jgi:CRP-like cAMP-binding protein
MTDKFPYEILRFNKDAYITMEDKRVPDQFYIINEGKVRFYIEVHVPNKEQSDILGPGDFFGIISAMSGHSQIETVQALTDVTLIAVNYSQFGHLIQNNTVFATKILFEFSKRMRNLNEILARITLKGSSFINVGHLFNVAEYYFNQKLYDAALYAYRQYMKYCPNGDFLSEVKERLKEMSKFIDIKKSFEKPNDPIRVYPKDSMIFSEGEPGEEVFIIKKGKVNITKVLDDKQILLAVLKNGDIFGEMSIFESKPRGASAVAYEDCHLVVVNQTNFERLIQMQPLLITRLTSLLAKRLWLLYKQIANTQVADPVRRMHDILFIQLEKKRVDFNTRDFFVFDFGPKELISMVGLSESDGDAIIQQLFKNKYICLLQDRNKIAVKDLYEYFKQANYYRKMR